MSPQEFSDTFDVLYNNIMSNQAPGLDNYEKSVFLTKAQNEIVKSYFNARLNKSQEGFDGNEKRQIDFSMLMKTVKYTDGGDAINPTFGGNSVTYDFGEAILDNNDNSRRVKLDNDVLLIVNEFVDVKRPKESSNMVRLVATPLDYKEYAKLMAKPYKRPANYQAWRILDNVAGVNEAELVVGQNDGIKSYTIRYVKVPYPIILENLGTGVSIGGYNLPFCDYYKKKATETVDELVGYITPQGNYLDINDDILTPDIKKDGIKVYKKVNKPTTLTTTEGCELNTILHEEILQRAVELAKAAYQGDVNTQIAVGNQSATNIGIVPQARQ